jgi:hypothetical protein
MGSLPGTLDFLSSHLLIHRFAGNNRGTYLTVFNQTSVGTLSMVRSFAVWCLTTAITCWMAVHYTGNHACHGEPKCDICIVQRTARRLAAHHAVRVALQRL